MFGYNSPGLSVRGTDGACYLSVAALLHVTGNHTTQPVQAFSALHANIHKGSEVTHKPEANSRLRYELVTRRKFLRRVYPLQGRGLSRRLCPADVTF
jgi:hypothetical protein